MENAEFARVLNLGLGRALLHLREHDAAPYHEAILYACLNNTAYDPQVEGDRSVYLYEIIEATGDIRYYRDAVLKALLNSTPAHDWTQHQLYDLALQFARRGHEQAKAAMYKAYKRHFATSVIGHEQLTELDGVAGLIYALDPSYTREPQFPDSKHAWEYDSWLRDLEATHPQAQLQAELEQAYQRYPQLRRFITDIQKYRKRQQQRSRKRNRTTGRQILTYVDIRQYFQSYPRKRRPLINWRRWAMTASDEEMVAAASDLLIEEHPKRLLLYLQVFKDRAFPLPTIDPLLALVEEKSNQPERRRASWNVLSVLENIQNERVRVLALRLFDDPEKRGSAVRLLKNNFESGDWSMLENMVKQISDAKTLHDFGFSFEDLVEQYREPQAINTLLYLYEHDSCSVCRRRFVKLLHAMHALPISLLNECLYDAQEDIRALAKQWRSASA